MQQGGVSCVFRFVSNSRFEKGEGQLDEGDEFSIGRKGARRKRHRGWLNGYRHRERRKPLEPATKVCTRLILNVNLHHICMHHRAYPRLTRSTPGLNTSLIAVYISPPVHAAMPVPLRPGHVWNLVIRRLILSLSFEFVDASLLLLSYVSYFYSNRRLHGVSYESVSLLSLCNFIFWNISFYFLFSIVFRIVVFNFSGDIDILGGFDHYIDYVSINIDFQSVLKNVYFGMRR